MPSENNTSWVQSAGRRMAMVAALIVAVTLFWVVLFLYTDLPTLAMVGIAVAGLALLSIAVSWAAMAAPGRKSGHQSPSGNS